MKQPINNADKGTVYVDNDLNTLKTDIKVNINPEKTRTLGVFTADIDRTLRLAIADLKIGTFTNEASNRDDFDVIVSVKHDKFATLDVFKNLFVNNAIGTPVPVSHLATISF